MMGYNEACQELTLADTFKGGRKLRPLVPRALLSPTNNVNTTCCTRFHGPDIFSQHHHHHIVGEQGNKNNSETEITQQVVVSSRWNPTPEQLRALEELYRCGTRTPSAEQIQLITAQLRCYGKIEGKNVFYWFQNHKARERQKRRREVQLLASAESTHITSIADVEFNRNDQGSGADRVSLDIEQKKSLRAPSTYCSVIAQESESDPQIQGTEKAGPVIVSAEAAQTTDGWIQFDAREFHHHHHHDDDHHNYYNTRQNLLSPASERNATWKLTVQPSNSTSNNSPHSNYNPNYHYYCPLPPPSSTATISPFSLSSKLLDLNQSQHEEGERKSLTLELLPLVRADSAHNDKFDDDEATLDYNAFPYYKFL